MKENCLVLEKKVHVHWQDCLVLGKKVHVYFKSRGVPFSFLARAMLLFLRWQRGFFLLSVVQ